MATRSVSGCQTPRSLPQDQCVCGVRTSPRQNSAASPCRLRESSASCPGDWQKVNKHARHKKLMSMHHLPHLYIPKWFACETSQGASGWGHHSLLGVSGDWVEPSDSRRPEERLLWGSAGRQKPHTTHRAALLEEQVSTSEAAYPLASTCSSVIICPCRTSKVELFQKFLLVLLIILISGHLCCQVKNGIWSPVLFLFLFLCCADAAEWVLMRPISTTFIICLPSAQLWQKLVWSPSVFNLHICKYGVHPLWLYKLLKSFFLKN